jgi:hypothetical protein
MKFNLDSLIENFNKINIKTTKERLDEVINRKIDKNSKTSIRRQKKNKRKIIKKLEQELKKEKREEKFFKFNLIK